MSTTTTTTKSVNSAGHSPWARFPEVKLLIYFAGLGRHTDEELLNSHHWASLGVTAEGLYNTVTKRLPWFPAVYREATGKVLTPERVRDRFFNFYWDRSLGPLLAERSISGEHPTRSPRLKPYFEMGKAVWSWLSEDSAHTVSCETARALFDAPPIARKETLARLDATLGAPASRRGIAGPAPAGPAAG